MIYTAYQQGVVGGQISEFYCRVSHESMKQEK